MNNCIERPGLTGDIYLVFDNTNETLRSDMDYSNAKFINKW